MNITNKQYDEMVKDSSPKSPIFKDTICAFLIGGGICAFGQLLNNIYMMNGLDKETAGTTVSITLILISTLLTSLGVYDNIAKVAGAGTIVPITGFANSVVSPAIEFKSEGHVLGTSAKMFSIAGPVIVFGLAAGVLYGFIIWILGLF